METRPQLANAELAVMELLWNEEPLTARAIRERLYPESDKTQHGTVQRLLQRLADKGFVNRDDTLSVHLFRPAVRREEYGSDQLESLAQRLTGGSIAPLMTQLVAEKRISREEIDRLRRILDDDTEATEDRS